MSEVSLRPFAESDFDGELGTSSNGDRFKYDADHKLKVALRDSWGETLVYFGEQTNLLDDSDPTRGVQMIFHDDSRPHFEVRQSHNDPTTSHLRIQQSVRFVKRHILEVEALITNLGNTALTAHHELPLLNPTPTTRLLKNADGDAYNDGRLPAASGRTTHELPRAPGGWVTYQASDNQQGVGLYWENRNESIHTEASSEINNVRSDFLFTIPPHDSVRARFYLLLGGYEEIRKLAESLDHSLPPFGRIETNRIEEDTRSVTLQGWVLDNKGLNNLELWVDGKKDKDLVLSVPREDVCATYPGYSMCTQNHTKIGFEATYQRPAGQGCQRVVEVRARDSDGNSRTIARTGILPVQYKSGKN